MAILFGYVGFVVALYELRAERPLSIAAFSLPAVAVLVVPTVLDFFAGLIHAYRRLQRSRWNQRFYRFDGRQMRVVEADQTLWFSSADVHLALGLEKQPRLLEHLERGEYARRRMIGYALTVAGIKRLTSDKNDARSRRFRRWAEHGVLASWEKSMRSRR